MEHAGYGPVVDVIRDLVAAAGGGAVLVGVGGSVCVGKSTTCARVARLLDPVATEIVTTDGFLLPNHELERRGLTLRKGFPESYDTAAIRGFLAAARQGTPGLSVPCYSHERYDVVPDEYRPLGDAAVLFFEGVNALRFHEQLDLTVYVDADEAAIEVWYVDRLVEMFRAAPAGSFYAELGYDDAAQRAFAREIWARINRVNLDTEIRPTRDHAGVVIEKAADHAVTRVRFEGRVG
jgi:type I pantothenate kinase